MESVGADDFYQMIKPQLCGLLDLLRIGVVFERAKGNYLYHRRDGEEVGVLDLVGGYPRRANAERSANASTSALTADW